MYWLSARYFRLLTRRHGLETLHLDAPTAGGSISGVPFPAPGAQRRGDGLDEGRMVRDAEKRPDRSQRRNRVADQILVADRQEVVRRHRGTERRDCPHLLTPRACRFVHVLRPEAGFERRQRDVAPIAHHVNELRLREELAQHVRRSARG